MTIRERMAVPDRYKESIGKRKNYVPKQHDGTERRQKGAV